MSTPVVQTGAPQARQKVARGKGARAPPPLDRFPIKCASPAGATHTRPAVFCRPCGPEFLIISDPGAARFALAPGYLLPAPSALGVGSHLPSPTITNHHPPSPTITHHHQPSPTITNPALDRSPINCASPAGATEGSQGQGRSAASTAAPGSIPL
jgi:hypothetical protein